MPTAVAALNPEGRQPDSGSIDPCTLVDPKGGTKRRHERRRPESTLLHRVVVEHAETLLLQARQAYPRGLPRYVEEELRRYVKCGVLACGFSRARCRSCGADLLVAFSCKRRGCCPSCTTRRMVELAAHLSDHVLPDVPLRQWVLTVPFELRLLLARDPRLLGAVSRVLVDEVSRFVRERIPAQPERARASGAVTFVQRFGSSLNLNVHFHLVALDGAFQVAPEVLLGDEPLCFVPSCAPRVDEVTAVCDRIRRRVRRLLVRRGLLPRASAADSHEERAVTEPDPEARDAALEACLRASLFAGERTSSEPRARRRSRRPPPPLGADLDGFNLDASVSVSAGDRAGRERLCRSGARPPLNAARLSQRPDGRLAYALRRPKGSHLVMTPLEFLARLCALIPPPFYPLVRYHGVLAAASAWRSRVVPVSTGPKARRRAQLAAAPVPSPEASSPPRAGPPAESTAPGPEPAWSPGQTPVLDKRTPPAPTAAALWASLLATKLSRYDWAQLLRRVFDVDALRCPRCDGRLAFIAVLTDARHGHSLAAILEHLGLPSEPPHFARARDPTDPLAPQPSLDLHDS